MGRLERHLDLDLIARVKAGNAGRRAEPEPAKRVKPHRPASDYRGARRAKCKQEHGIWKGRVKIKRGAYWSLSGKDYPYASERQNTRIGRQETRAQFPR